MSCVGLTDDLSINRRDDTAHGRHGEDIPSHELSSRKRGREKFLLFCTLYQVEGKRWCRVRLVVE